jgi:DNA-binding response OmpR family regulator
MDNTTLSPVVSEPNVNVGIDLDAIDAVDRKLIMVIEDDLDTIFLIKQILVVAGFNVVSASNGAEALRKVVEFKPDIILLDIMMPDMDGWETLKYLHQMSSTPVIVVSALGTRDEIVEGLRMGVDDYISKPFYNAELVERIKAVLRRTQRPGDVSQLVFPKIGLVIDLINQEVVLEDKKIRLTPKEFSVFALLAKNAPSIVTYEKIAEVVWESDSDDYRNRTKYLIYLLRRKFDNAKPDSNLILNIGRMGYKLQTEG